MVELCLFKSMSKCFGSILVWMIALANPIFLLAGWADCKQPANPEEKDSIGLHLLLEFYRIKYCRFLPHTVSEMYRKWTRVFFWRSFGKNLKDLLLITLNNCLTWSKITPSSNDKCVSSSLRDQMKRISGSKAVCSVFRYSVIGLVWKWRLSAKVLHCITKKIFISALSRAHCCNQSGSGMREKLQWREIRRLRIL